MAGRNREMVGETFDLPLENANANGCCVDVDDNKTNL